MGNWIFICEWIKFKFYIRELKIDLKGIIYLNVIFLYVSVVYLSYVFSFKYKSIKCLEENRKIYNYIEFDGVLLSLILILL